MVAWYHTIPHTCPVTRWAHVYQLTLTDVSGDSSDASICFIRIRSSPINQDRQMTWPTWKVPLQKACSACLHSSRTKPTTFAKKISVHHRSKASVEEFLASWASADFCSRQGRCVLPPVPVVRNHGCSSDAPRHNLDPLPACESFYSPGTRNPRRSAAVFPPREARHQRSCWYPMRKSPRVPAPKPTSGTLECSKASMRIERQYCTTKPSSRKIQSCTNDVTAVESDSTEVPWPESNVMVDTAAFAPTRTKNLPGRRTLR